MFIVGNAVLQILQTFVGDRHTGASAADCVQRFLYWHNFLTQKEPRCGYSHPSPISTRQVLCFCVLRIPGALL